MWRQIIARRSGDTVIGAACNVRNERIDIALKIRITFEREKNEKKSGHFVESCAEKPVAYQAFVSIRSLYITMMTHNTCECVCESECVHSCMCVGVLHMLRSFPENVDVYHFGKRHNTEKC